LNLPRKAVAGVLAARMPEAQNLTEMLYTALADTGYCQRRARVVGNTVYYGGRPNPELLQTIRTLRDATLVFDHEKWLREDVREFKRLVRRHWSA
jgi:hypothetical protein